MRFAELHTGRNKRAVAPDAVIENQLLRVTLRGDSGAIQVLDKRIGHTWTTYHTATMRTLNLMPTSGAILIDGDLSDWPTSEVLRMDFGKEHVSDGDNTILPESWFKLGWSPDALFIAVLIKDDKPVSPKIANRFWEGDAIEFWIEDRQYFAGMIDGKPVMVRFTDEDKVPENIEVAVVCVKDVDGVRSYEVSAPWSSLGLAPAQAAGGNFPFALAVEMSSKPGTRRQAVLFPARFKQVQIRNLRARHAVGQSPGFVARPSRGD